METFSVQFQQSTNIIDLLTSNTKSTNLQNRCKYWTRYQIQTRYCLSPLLNPKNIHFQQHLTTTTAFFIQTQRTLIELLQQTKNRSQFVVNNCSFITFHCFSHLAITAEPCSTKLIIFLFESFIKIRQNHAPLDDKPCLLNTFEDHVPNISLTSSWMNAKRTYAKLSSHTEQY